MLDSVQSFHTYISKPHGFPVVLKSDVPHARKLTQGRLELIARPIRILIGDRPLVEISRNHLFPIQPHVNHGAFSSDDTSIPLSRGFRRIDSRRESIVESAGIMRSNLVSSE